MNDDEPETIRTHSGSNVDGSTKIQTKEEKNSERDGLLTF